MILSWNELLEMYENSVEETKTQMLQLFDDAPPEIKARLKPSKTEIDFVDLWLNNLKKIQGDQDDSS